MAFTPVVGYVGTDASDESHVKLVQVWLKVYKQRKRRRHCAEVIDSRLCTKPLIKFEESHLVCSSKVL